MLARVAERVYWLARYLERAEDTARLILVRHNAVLDLPRTIQPGWELLVDALGAKETFDNMPGAASENNIVNFVFGEKANPSSIISSLTAARESMRTTREVLPREAWERMNSVYLSVLRRSSKHLPRSSRHATLKHIVECCQQISGMLSGTMNHDAPYQLIRMGRFMERADMSTRILDLGSASLRAASEEALPYQNALWISVLQSLSAHQMYRLSVGANVQPTDVVEFLLRSRQFPRATAFCLEEIEASMKKLPHEQGALDIINSLQRKVRRARPSTLEGDKLHKFLDSLRLRMGDIQQTVSDAWFGGGQ